MRRSLVGNDIEKQTVEIHLIWKSFPPCRFLFSSYWTFYFLHQQQTMIASSRVSLSFSLCFSTITSRRTLTHEYTSTCAKRVISFSSFSSVREEKWGREEKRLEDEVDGEERKKRRETYTFHIDQIIISIFFFSIFFLIFYSSPRSIRRFSFLRHSNTSPSSSSNRNSSRFFSFDNWVDKISRVNPRQTTHIIDSSLEMN